MGVTSFSHFLPQYLTRAILGVVLAEANNFIIHSKHYCNRLMGPAQSPAYPGIDRHVVQGHLPDIEDRVKARYAIRHPSILLMLGYSELGRECLAPCFEVGIQAEPWSLQH
jgi:hypothetical protein